MGNTEGEKASPSGFSHAAAPFRAIRKYLIIFLKWSVPYRSANRKIDPFYTAVWRIEVNEENIRNELHRALPEIPQAALPTDEEGVRRLIRQRLPPGSSLAEKEDDASSSQSQNGKVTSPKTHEKDRKCFEESPEESWTHLPSQIRDLLASWNAHHLEDKIDLLVDESFHTKLGKATITRSRDGVRKTFKMMRHGFKAGVSRLEYYGVGFFALFLVFLACFPDVAAGFLGERSYNQRSVGSRIATLCQLFSLWTFPYHSVRLLFNWSLERLLGALVGNALYALSACVPALNRAYHTQWFRWTLLGLSLTWQIGVQFYTTVRNYASRVRVRKQMRRLRSRQDTDAICWGDVDKIVSHETTSLKAYVAQQSNSAAVGSDWQDVPYRVRVERFIKFSSTYSLGRPCDQLIGILKDDLEDIVNIYDDYSLSAMNPEEQNKEGGHVEPRAPKMLLVFFDIGFFAYICFSFWRLPFTFNTTVAYGTVVILKQAVLAFKKYQTIKSARRLFTNMVSFNILGIFLVSTPVTVNPDILKPTGNFIALLFSMIFATLFLAEPIAPLLLNGTEKLVSMWNRAFAKKGAEVAPKAGSESKVDQATSSGSSIKDPEKEEADRAELERESLGGDLDREEPEKGSHLTMSTVTQV